MQVQINNYDRKHDHLSQFETYIRFKYPNWNEKYYQILSRAWNKLTRPNAEASLTADKLIKESKTSRPTWYSYFKSVQHYYSDVFTIIGTALIDADIHYLREKVTIQNWMNSLHSMRIGIVLANTKMLSDYFPVLKPAWRIMYENAIWEVSTTLAPEIQLTEKRTQLLIANIFNELILHTDKYYSNPQHYFKFVYRVYSMFLLEQNS